MISETYSLKKHAAIPAMLIRASRVCLLGFFYLLTFTITLFFILIFSGLFAFIPISANLKARFTRKTISIAVSLGRPLLAAFNFIKINYIGFDNNPHPTPCIYIANHPSFIDAFLIFSKLPNTVCIIKSDLTRNPLLRMMIKLTGHISNSGQVDLVDQCILKLNSGVSLLIFPEGTRTSDTACLNFKRGVATIALKSQAPLVPIIIKQNKAFLGKTGPWFWPALDCVEFTLKKCYPIEINKLEVNQNYQRDATFELTKKLESFFTQELT